MAGKFRLKNGLEFRQTRKKDYAVYVCMPPKGTNVVNKLEGAKYTTDEKRMFVISGTVGEQWVIDPGKMAKTYQFMDGTEISPKTLNRRLRGGFNRLDAA